MLLKTAVEIKELIYNAAGDAFRRKVILEYIVSS